MKKSSIFEENPIINFYSLVPQIDHPVALCYAIMLVHYTFLMIFRSTKNFQKKYGLTLTAATFVIIDYSEASMEIACEWQKCIGDTINLVSPLKCGS